MRTYALIKACPVAAPNLLPVGYVVEVTRAAYENPPSGMLRCDGQEMLVTDSPALYAVIGHNFKPHLKGVAGLRRWRDERRLLPHEITFFLPLVR